MKNKIIMAHYKTINAQFFNPKQLKKNSKLKRRKKSGLFTLLFWDTDMKIILVTVILILQNELAISFTSFGA